MGESEPAFDAVELSAGWHNFHADRTELQRCRIVAGRAELVRLKIKSCLMALLCLGFLWKTARYCAHLLHGL